MNAVPGRRSRRTTLSLPGNGALDFLGEPAAVIVHPDDAGAAGVLDPVTGMVRYSGVPVTLRPRR